MTTKPKTASKTKVKAGPPPERPLTRRLSVSIPDTETPNNLTIPNSGRHDLNFKVSPELRRRFKTEAAARGWNMKQLLEACFESFLRQHGELSKDLFREMIRK